MASALTSLPSTSTSTSYSSSRLRPFSSRRRLPDVSLRVSPLPLRLSSPILPLRLRLRLRPAATPDDAVKPSGEDDAGKTSGGDDAAPEGSKDPSSSDAGNELEELKRKLAEARASSGSGGVGGFWSGVAEEVGTIEWPAFGKVVGTTGVVLSVIAGSSIALLTVNAILSELSDRVFAGRGVQDFF